MRVASCRSLSPLFTLTITLAITSIMKFTSAISTSVLAFSALALAADQAPISASSPQTNLTVAAQLGPYPVAIYEHEVKTSRPDPLAPTAQRRRLLLTVYRPFLDNFTCPLENQVHVPYIPQVVTGALLELLGMPSVDNASAIFNPVKLLNCSKPVPPSSSSSSGPLLLFSPGLGGTHHIYASTLQAAASSGYTVIAIDHTYEAAAVVFPDGSVAYRNKSIVDPNAFNDTAANFLQTVRDADTKSVLDAIESGSVPGTGRYTNSSSSSTSSTSSTSSSTSSSTTKPLRAVMYGHSLGGSTAANAALLDSRITGAINMDGTFFGPAANSTLHKPLLMISSDGGDTTWLSYYTNHVRGWKTFVHPLNTQHYGYTDIPVLADLLGLRGSVFPPFLTGAVDSRRLQEIVWRYTTEFFGYATSGTKPQLLLAKSAGFADVMFVGHAEAAK